jgi:glutaredoxin
MHLDELGVEYDYIDVDHDEAASQWVKDHNDGKEKKPTIDITAWFSRLRV